MVFCAYCGKSFTRKEHLERHIPSHTNVKPHRCSACQLSFSRRDLLQRHHSTYHEARDPMDPLPGGVPTVAGRTPIACQNCASAKTGCDKRVPCSRCADKNLPCAARFARRSSKAAARAAQARGSISGDGQSTIATVQGQAGAPLMMDVDQEMAHVGAGEAGGPGVVSIDSSKLQMASCLSSSSSSSSSSLGRVSSDQGHGDFSPDDCPSPHSKLDIMHDFMPLGTEYAAAAAPHELSYSDLVVWPEYPVDLTAPESIYHPQAAIHHHLRPDMTTLPAFGDFSDVSETMTVSTSSRASVHTRGTSIISTATTAADHIEPGLKAMTMNSNSNDRINMRLIASNETIIPEFDVVIAGEDSWPLARCNPPPVSGMCPRTAIVHLEALEQKCKQDSTWDSLEMYLSSSDTASCSFTQRQQCGSVVAINSRTRDKMTALTQSFLHKALAVHRSGSSSNSTSSFQSYYGMNSMNSGNGPCSFLLLPPNSVLEHFLDRHVRSTAGHYYPMAHAMQVDANEMMNDRQEQPLVSCSLSLMSLLLMIAQGAASMPLEEARFLAAGLAETCRITLSDMFERDIELSADPSLLRSALLWTNVGAWSGDKWQMDLAMSQRGTYLSMLKHAGMLEPQPSMIPTFTDATSPDLQWRTWTHREAQNRLVYNWVTTDLEMSLFHDTSPLLSISELHCPLPSPEMLWTASNAEQWLAGIQTLYGRRTHNLSPQLLLLTPPSSLTPSLYDLFQDFLHDKLSCSSSSSAATRGNGKTGGSSGSSTGNSNNNNSNNSLSPQQMRLLLHPLQAMLCHLRQLMSCFSDVLGGGCARRSIAAGATRGITKASVHSQLEEVQALLQRWYELAVGAVNSPASSSPSSSSSSSSQNTTSHNNNNSNQPNRSEADMAAARCNLALYHLISLNAVTNFREVERLARKEGFEHHVAPGTANGKKATTNITHWELGLRHKRCIQQREEAIFHCGQVLRWLRSVPAEGAHRPSWWSTAVYRVVLVLWTDGIGRLDPSFKTTNHTTTATAPSTTSPMIASTSSHGVNSDNPNGAGGNAAGPSPECPGPSSLANMVFVDQLAPENPAIISYLWNGEGTAAVTGVPDGSSSSMVDLDSPPDVLDLGISLLKQGGGASASSTRIGDGLQRKLATLAGNWRLDSIGNGTGGGGVGL
ncbi:hypothetical protein BD289DRAFT_466404 [Coniella lustricola]|uniref:Fungal-specific transcription factor domain-domain-containing protein n=1 Tax=Coniella lustricola TaxID=2025994 RepID=A0A2T3ACQ7_9PEZI|nr:hypothetical protein BD289DRAFT_466404 [Coniella lustricola]